MRLGGSHLPSTSPVIGLLFGTQNGSDIEIADATEAIYAMKDDNTAVLNIAEIEAKRKLWLEVYKEYELVGWYSVGAVSEQHMAIHQSIAASLVESPFFLLMDADALTASSENSSVRANLNRLPVMLFQAESTGRDAIFVSLDYRIKSSTYESFAVEAITKSTPLAVGVSAMEESNRSVITALDTLGDKVDAVVACLKECRGADAASKSSSEYQSFLRQVRCITSQLPPAPLDTDATAVCPETTEVDASNVSLCFHFSGFHFLPLDAYFHACLHVAQPVFRKLSKLCWCRIWPV